MARIRTIKPEFPQAESMGVVSREARLLYVLLWTVVDDAGRTRGNSRLLASLLYPYDDDAPGLIDGWLDELEAERCIVRYSDDGESYLAVLKWTKHQRIDRPTESRLPAPPTVSRNGASPREDSRALNADLGPRTKDQGPGTNEQPTPQSDDCDRWQPLEGAASEAYGGKRTRHKTTNARLAWVGNIVRVGGRASGNDPPRAVDLWWRWWRSIEPGYRPTPTSAADKWGAWLSDVDEEPDYT